MKMHTLINNIIFILFCILCLLLMFISYKLISQNKLPDINISPFTGERLRQKSSHKNSVEVIFNVTTKNDPTIGLSDANLIIEYLNPKNSLVYKAIYYDNVTNKVSSTSDLTENSFSSIPKFNFIDITDIHPKHIKKANSIFICFNDYFSSDFIYNYGQYYHFKYSKKDIDTNSNKPICTSNVLVQFTDSKLDKENINGSGSGLLFCGGKVIDIKWNKNRDSPIKIVDKNGEPIFLIRGNTWWVIIDNNSSVAYSQIK